MTPAETALSLLFKKLHPHLEDAAHALAKGAKANELQRLHLKLVLARHQRNYQVGQAPLDDVWPGPPCTA